MTITFNENVVSLPTKDECKDVAGAHIPQTHTDTNIAFDVDPEIGFASIERQMQVYENLIGDLTADSNRPRFGHGPVLYVGLDAEWVLNQDTQENEILSVQFFLVCENGDYPKIIYPKSRAKSDRPSFIKSLCAIILEAKNEGFILEWPSQVVICGFFLRIDLAVFSDLVRFKQQLDNAGGRVATIGDDAQIPVEFDSDDLEKILKNRTEVVNDDNISRFLSVRFIDMARHAPEGTALKELGNQLGLPKLDLPEGFHIEHMDVLLNKDQQSFENYAIRDAEIPVCYYLSLTDFAKENSSAKVLPATGSGLGVRIFLDTLKESGDDFNSVFGLEEKSSRQWMDGGNDSSGKVRTINEDLMCDLRAIHEPFVASCYHGGRNECYMFGPTEVADWFDFDLAGAYTTGMVDLRHIDYENVRTSQNPRDFCGHVMGFAYVKFKHPENVRFPVFPVNLGNLGLVFPVQGESYCTAAEIEVALNLGCEVTIIHGVIFPWLEGDSRIFEGFTRKIRKLRAAHPKGSIQEKYAKFLGNACYGKTAQGLKPKKVFDTRSLKSVQLPPSQITHAAMAAHTTGFVRATLAEILNAVPSNFKIVSATTDGFLTDAPLDQIVLSGPIARRYQSLCDRVAPNSRMLEIKHHVCQLIPFKTRGQMTSVDFEGGPVVLAKAGISPPLEKGMHNNYIVNLFLSRQPGEKTESRTFPSVREQWVHGVDLIKTTRTQALNMEFDMKRSLSNPVVRVVNGVEHIAFDSIPWPDAKIGEAHRAFFDGWRRTHCLKSLADWNHWCEHFLIASQRRGRRAKNSKEASINMTAEGSVGLLRRLFLRAYTQEKYGLQKSMSYPELAAWLSATGYPTTVDELKNAKRAKIVENTVPKNVSVTVLCTVFLAQFPAFEIDKFLIAENL